jgi:hypothetical protein
MRSWESVRLWPDRRHDSHDRMDIRRNQLAEHRARLVALDRERVKAIADRDAVAASVERLKSTVPLVRERHAARPGACRSEDRVENERPGESQP